MSGGGGSYTAGYRYYFGIHMGISRSGPDGIDELVEVRVGDRTAWTGSVTQNTVVPVDAYNLFGGEDGEGGVQGNMWVLMGHDTQLAPDELANLRSGDITEGPGGGGGSVAATPKLSDTLVYAENLYGSINGTSASAGLLFQPDGHLLLVTFGTNGSRSDPAVDQWVDRFGETVNVSVDPADFEVHASMHSGSAPTSGNSLNTWYDLTNEVEFTLNAIASGSIVLFVQVRKKSTGQTATAYYTLSISSVDNPGGA